MTRERTLAMIKPDATAAGYTNKIIDDIIQEGFDVIDSKIVNLNREEAENFYAVHNGMFFFNNLIDYITSGPIVALALERENAIKYLRQIVGSKDPHKAQEGTIRQKYGIDSSKNAIHSSDSPETAEEELKKIFPHLYDSNL
ncbi:MAG: nucleoside-diphosphate kinase [archaeon]